MIRSKTKERTVRTSIVTSFGHQRDIVIPSKFRVRSLARAYELHQRFKEGRESTEYNERVGRPSSRNVENVVLLSECVRKDCHETLERNSETYPYDFLPVPINGKTFTGTPFVSSDEMKVKQNAEYLFEGLRKKSPPLFPEAIRTGQKCIVTPRGLSRKVDLLRRCELFRIYSESSSPFVKKQEFRFTEKNRRYKAPGKFEYNRKDKKFPASTNYNKHYEAPVTKYESVQRYQDSAQKGYYNKNYEKHSNHNASKHMLRRTIQNRRNSKNLQKKLALIFKEGLRTKEIFFGKVKITALTDSGSTVSLLRENTSRRIMDPTKLSKNKMLLTGIGEAQVTTISSFEHKFKIDDENYSLTWHVVPTDKLKFEAVIGSDLLEQASISFIKGVKFNKYENHAQLMQISAENLQEELDLRHVENRQIKKELEKLIQDYKPEKQHLLTSQ
ncbi:RVP domain-containing protein [Trichonephila clavipes]|nr:RVP domain-containing protein [Trichonephila clavipes]